VRWRVKAPHLLFVADFTYVPMVARFGYTAFVIPTFIVIDGKDLWHSVITRTLLAECTYSKRAVFLSDPTSPCEQRIAVLGLRGTRLVVQSLCGLGLMGRGAL